MFFKKSEALKKAQEEIKSLKKELKDAQVERAYALENLEVSAADADAKIRQLELSQKDILVKKDQLEEELSVKQRQLAQEIMKHDELHKRFVSESTVKNREIELKDNFLAQNRGVVEELQNTIRRLHQEAKELAATNERLHAQIKAMNVCIMEEKDVKGRPFARIAPLVDAEGYEALCKGEGRMQMKITYPDGNKKLVYVTLA